MKRKFAPRSRSRRVPRTVMSRSSISPASLPSISPAWIPDWASSVGLPPARIASGVKARSAEAITIQRSCPAPLFPRETSFSSGAACASRRSQATVSS